jgi:RNA polymerase sigma-70 factor (ECF subfamily)
MVAISKAANLDAACIRGMAPEPEQPNSESELVRQLQAGNEPAFRGFVERYQSKIYRLAYGILGNREDADDVAQQVFMKVYFSIKSFEGRSSLYTWLNRITINKCYEFLRKKHATVSYEAGFDRCDDRICARIPADPCPTSETTVLQRDFLNKLLLRIPERDRQLLLLRELEGYSVTQLSKITGMNEATIKVRLFRTRQQLLVAATRGRLKSRPVGRFANERFVTISASAGSPAAKSCTTARNDVVSA